MKVAYLIGSLNRGGAETLLLDIFRKCESASFSMIVIHRKGGHYEKEFEEAEPSCYRIEPRKWHFYAYLRQLRKTIIEEQVTIIHAFYWLDVIYAKLATIGLNIPIVITFHGYLGGEAGMVTGLQYRTVMRIAKKLCFVSKEQLETYRHRYGSVVAEKGMILYNGLNFDKFDVKYEKVNGIEDNGNIKLCMVGNFNSVRSQMVVVKALKIIDENREYKESVDFYFVGGRCNDEEYYYDQCVAYCNEEGLENVHFLGVRKDVPAILKSMDGFVYSSCNDTFGIAVIEAVACGLPVVVNDHPVMKEVCSLDIAETGRAVRFYRSGDAEDCAGKIKELMNDLLQNRTLLHEDCQQSMKHVRQRYSIDMHITNLENIYKHL